LISGALLCASILINDPGFSLIKCETDLLQPIKEEGLIIFKSKTEIDGSVKKVLKCSASINDIEFLQAHLSFVKMIS